MKLNITDLFVRCCASAMTLCASFAAAEAPFDPTFAFGAPYSFRLNSAGAAAVAIARDETGHLITATTINSSSSSELGVTRHLPAPIGSLIIIPGPSEGMLDQQFGNTGVASGFFGTFYSYAAGIAVDHQNRIIIGGTVSGVTTCDDGSTPQITAYSLVRLKNDGGNSDGQADLSFGGFGDAIYGDCDHNTFGLTGLAIEKDDGIIAIGSTWQGSRELATLIRWTPEGKIDTAFGSNGLAVIAFGGEDTEGNAIAISTDGKITAAIDTEVDGNRIGLLARYSNDGNLDKSFGTNGFAQLGTLGEFGYLCCIAIDSHDRVVAAGTVDLSTDPYDYRAFTFVRRIRKDGSADETFGLHGLVYPSETEINGASGLTLDQKDRPIVVGSTHESYSPYQSAVLFHLNLDGSSNSAVGLGGTYTTALGFSNTFATDVLVDPEGRPTLTAIAHDSDGQEVSVLVRYDEMFGDGFD